MVRPRPADNGRRKGGLPSFRQIRRSTIEEIEGMITGNNTKSSLHRHNNTSRLQQLREEHETKMNNGKSSFFNIGNALGASSERRRTPTPPLDQSDYFSDEDQNNNLSPHNTNSPNKIMGHHRNMSSHSLVSINSGDGGSPQKHQRSSSSRTTAQQEVQKEFWPPLRALLKLGLAIVMIGWMTGTISLTNLPSKSVYVISSPLDYIPGMSSSIIRRKLVSKKNRELLGK